MHLPLEQTVFFIPGQEVAAFANAMRKDTTLTAWFKLNVVSEEARQLNYCEIPQFYYFKKSGLRWMPRKKKVRVIGRIYSITFKQLERFFLRLLLIEVKGATSFEDLLTVNGVHHATFKSAAAARTLFEDDTVWSRAIEEASTFTMPLELRQLFVDMCVHCNLSDPRSIFDTNLYHLMEDYLRRGHNEEVAKNLNLRWIQEKLQGNGFNMEVDFLLPAPTFDLINSIIAEERESVDLERIEECIRIGELMPAQLSDVQKDVFNTMLTSINEQISNRPRLFFLDGPGGTGKTYLYNTLINVLVGRGSKVIASATTGIASTLLIDGATFHSQIKIFPPITETTRSRIEQHQFEAQRIREASLIIIDEVTMMNSHCLQAIDELFRRVMKKPNVPFGNKVLLCGGDFRQCLPVVKHGNRVKIVESTIKNAEVWLLYQQLRLTQNMRTVVGSQQHAEWLIEL